MVETVRFVPTQSFGRRLYKLVVAGDDTANIVVPAGTKLIYYSILLSRETGANAVEQLVIRVSGTSVFRFNTGHPFSTSPIVSQTFLEPGLLVADNSDITGTDVTVSNVVTLADGTSLPVGTIYHLTISYSLVP